MKDFIAIAQALFWFTLCVAAALFLLVAALVYNGLIVLKKGFSLRKFEFPKLEIAR
ncbi:MAG: hypothetical protein HYW63_01410 [Candidatus Levybacteria bacterium]|nr:hypothetical protein [Candidatus Levybacteria bacterium]